MRLHCLTNNRDNTNPSRCNTHRRSKGTVQPASGYATTAPASRQRSRPGCSRRSRDLTRLAPRGTDWGYPSCGVSWKGWVDRLMWRAHPAREVRFSLPCRERRSDSTAPSTQPDTQGPHHSGNLCDDSDIGCRRVPSLAPSRQLVYIAG